MKNKFMRSLSAVLAVILAMTLSFAVLAESTEETSVEESTVEETSVDATSEEATSTEASVESSAEESVESSNDETAEESKEASSEASAETSTETSKDASSETSNSNTEDQTTTSNFPWARVITLIVIVVLVVAAIVLSKTNTAIGQKIAKFFKEYASEIKKVSWLSPKDTVKSTAVVLVFIIVAAIVIGVLDYLFGHGIQLLAEIF